MHTTLGPPVSDIKPLARIIQMLPPALRPYGLLARLDRPIGIWLLFMPCLFALMLATDGFREASLRAWVLIPLVGAGAIIMRAAGCVINDLWDRDIDPRVERTRLRPLARGDVSPLQALVFLVLLLFTGLALLLCLEAGAILYGILAFVLIVLYPLAKRVTSWPQAILGLTFNMGVPITWCALTGSTEPATWVLYAGCVLWTLAYDTVYAHQDREDDERIGIGSTARLFGRHSPLIVGVLFAATLTLWGLAALMRGPFGLWTLAPLCGVVIFVVVMLWHWRPDDPVRTLAVFQAQRDLGWIALIYFFMMTGFVFS